MLHHMIVLHPHLSVENDGHKVSLNKREAWSEQCKIVNRPHDKAHIKRIFINALSKLGSDYDRVFDNCEHFASWAYTNGASSHQVQNLVLKSFMTKTTLTAGGALVGPALAPVATFMGSQTLGSVAVWAGAMAAPVTWPFIVGGIVVGGVFGYGAGQFVSYWNDYTYKDLGAVLSAVNLSVEGAQVHDHLIQTLASFTPTSIAEVGQLLLPSLSQLEAWLEKYCDLK